MNFSKLTFLLLLVLSNYGTYAQTPAYTAPALTNQESQTLVLLPDPQTYIKFDYNQPIFDLMLEWVNTNIKTLNIASVLCTGDLVEQNEHLYPDGVNGNQTSVQQWQSVSESFDVLNGKVPYFLTTGNHDYGYQSAENRKTFFDAYFPIQKNSKNQPLLRETGTNAQGKPSLTNALFELPKIGNEKYLLLVLEFAPRDETLAWARETIAQEKYRDYRVLLLTHAYMESNNEYIKTAGYKLTGPNYGDKIWEKLIYPSTNIRMVFAGHIGIPDDPKGHIAFRTDNNVSGKKVHQMVFNAQALGGGWHGNGGDGWLRLLEFLPDGNTIKVKTFSPLFAISPATRNLAWRKDPVDEFTIQLD